MESSYNNIAPERLAKIAEAGDAGPSDWSTAELGAILRHQLTTPVMVELGAMPPEESQRVQLLASAQQLLIRSAADVLAHPNPSPELLLMLKEFAKAQMEHPEAVLPREVSSALYWLCISAGIVRLRRLLSSLETAKLKQGLEWTASQSWMEPAMADLARTALHIVESEKL